MSSKLTRRGFLGLMAMGAAGTLLAGCTPKAAPAPKPTEAGAGAPTEVPKPTVPEATPAPKQKEVIRYTMYGHPKLAELMVTKFNETHDDVEVQFERSEGQGYWEKLSTAIAGGDVWDAFRSQMSDVMRYGPKGVVIDIKPFQESDALYPESLFLPGILDVFTVEGKRYGMPAWVFNCWLFYNKNLFDEAQVPYPTNNTTWEEYVEMCKKLTKTDSNGMITQYGANGWGGWTFPVGQDVWTAGGCFYYNEDLTKICLDDPITVKTLQDEADLMNVHKVNPSPLSPPSSPVSLLSKKVATEINGDYLPADAQDAWDLESFDAVQTPLHGAAKHTNYYWPDCLAIYSGSKKQAAAYKWVSWWGADPDSWAIQGLVVSPITTREYEDPKLAATWLKPPRTPGMISAAMDHAKAARIWRQEAHAAEFENTIYYSEIGNLWNNKATAEEVCKIMTQKGNELLAKPVE